MTSEIIAKRKNRSWFFTNIFSFKWQSRCRFGLGTIGLLTIQWLKIAGVKTIIGIDIQSEKLKQALDLGVADTIDPSVQDLEKRFLG